MPDLGAGMLLYDYDTAVATYSFSPLVPNAAIVRRIFLSNQNGDDTWVVSVSGQEVGRFFDKGSSGQQVLVGLTEEAGTPRDIFTYCRQALDTDLYYPVPEGQTLTIASVGGATADIALAFEEFPASAVAANLTNHPQGNRFLAPAWFYRDAVVTAVGEVPFDTEAGLSFVPSLFTGVTFPQGWTARIRELFTHSRNSGGDTTDHLAVIKRGQRLFTREALQGIPLASTQLALPPFTAVDPGYIPQLAAPIQYGPGDQVSWLLGVNAVAGSSQDFSAALQLAIVEYVKGA